MKQFYAIILITTLLALAAEPAMARQTGDWNAVKTLIGEEIAVRTQGGPTVFGVLRAADDAQIEVQLADRRSIAPANTVYRRADVGGVWRAQLRFGGRQTGRGALIGAGAGAAIGAGVYLGTRRGDDDGLAGASIPLGAIYGAGAGAVIGFFGKKKHRKKQLVYRA